MQPLLADCGNCSAW